MTGCNLKALLIAYTSTLCSCYLGVTERLGKTLPHTYITALIWSTIVDSSLRGTWNTVESRFLEPPRETKIDREKGNSRKQGWHRLKSNSRKKKIGSSNRVVQDSTVIVKKCKDCLKSRQPQKQTKKMLISIRGVNSNCACFVCFRTCRTLWS